MPSNLPLRTSIYIDGFNLYYGLLKGSMYKWVDLDCLVRKYLDPSKNPIQQIKYFTALVKSRPNDPQERFSYELGKYAMFKERLRLNVAASCQFPNAMSDQHGKFHKPPGW
jgi:hypothetical protein